MVYPRTRNPLTGRIWITDYPKNHFEEEETTLGGSFVNLLFDALKLVTNTLTTKVKGVAKQALNMVSYVIFMIIGMCGKIMRMLFGSIIWVFRLIGKIINWIF